MRWVARFLGVLVYLGYAGSAPAQPATQSFRANISGQTAGEPFTAGSYVPLAWPSIERNIGSRFVGYRWYPIQAGEMPREVHFNGQLWVENAIGTDQCGVCSTADYTARLVKNGDINQTTGALIGVPGSFKNTFIIPLSISDFANPGDYYEIRIYVTNSAAYLDKDKWHTWWQGGY
jgi:hypothetical protein